jgi:hypothetical protein
MDLKLTIMDYLDLLQNLVLDWESGVCSSEEYLDEKHKILNELFDIVINFSLGLKKQN